MQCINIIITQTSDIKTKFTIEFLVSTNIGVEIVSSPLTDLICPEFEFFKTRRDTISSSHIKFTLKQMLENVGSRLIGKLGPTNMGVGPVSNDVAD